MTPQAETRDLDKPLCRADDLVFGPDYDEAWEGSVQDARDRSRGSARAAFASIIGEPLTTIRVYKRYVRIYSARDVWLNQGQDRWFDDWMLENGIKTRWPVGEDEAEYFDSSSGARVTPPTPPEEPPSSWQPREHDYGWEFAHASNPAAQPVWICTQGDEPPPPKPDREGRVTLEEIPR